MSFPLVIRRKARADFDQAFDWYEPQRKGLGIEFAERVQTVLDVIAATPEINATIYLDVRKSIVRHFSYVVFYRVRNGRVVVLAIFHNKRNPKSWQSRA